MVQAVESTQAETERTKRTKQNQGQRNSKLKLHAKKESLSRKDSLVQANIQRSSASASWPRPMVSINPETLVHTKEASQSIHCDYIQKKSDRDSSVYRHRNSTLIGVSGNKAHTPPQEEGLFCYTQNELIIKHEGETNQRRSLSSPPPPERRLRWILCHQRRIWIESRRILLRRFLPFAADTGQIGVT